jgi:hypothetical protein
MGAKCLLTNVVPNSPGDARTQVKDSGSDSLSGAAGAAVTNRMVRVPDGSALFIYGDSAELRSALREAASDGVSGVCSASGQPMDKHFVRFDFGVTNATLIVLAAPQFWGGGQPAAPWVNAGGAVADTFFTQIMPGAMPAVLNVTLPDIVDHAKANHANALASVW